MTGYIEHSFDGSVLLITQTNKQINKQTNKTIRTDMFITNWRNNFVFDIRETNFKNLLFGIFRWMWCPNCDPGAWSQHCWRETSPRRRMAVAGGAILLQQLQVWWRFTDTWVGRYHGVLFVSIDNRDFAFFCVWTNETSASSQFAQIFSLAKTLQRNGT